MQTIKPMKKENIMLCTLLQHKGKLGQVRGTCKQRGEKSGHYIQNINIGKSQNGYKSPNINCFENSSLKNNDMRKKYPKLNGYQPDLHNWLPVSYF